MKIKIFGIDIDNYSFEEVVNLIIQHALHQKTPQYVVTPNAHHLVKLQQDKEFRDVYRHAFLSVPDGVPLLWVAKLQNTPLKGRVNGTDLLQRLCVEAANQGLKVFFLGGRPNAAEQAVNILVQQNPQLKVAGFYSPPYGFETDRVELAKINQMIKVAQPDLLFVGLGAPKQEKWMAANYQELEVPVSLGIGVSFELVAGVVARAPVWMQKAGLEWLFRFYVEPRRLFWRTLIINTTFIWLFVKQQFSKSRLKFKAN
jgi:N-acetylglucosaminyldiphosphoundecaprenol N-acetyl-beta-D-mannosaminyltransferase